MKFEELVVFLSKYKPKQNRVKSWIRNNYFKLALGTAAVLHTVGMGAYSIHTKHQASKEVKATQQRVVKLENGLDKQTKYIVHLEERVRIHEKKPTKEADKQENVLIRFDDKHFYTSSLGERHMNDAKFWYEQVFPTLNFDEKVLFWISADDNCDNYISIKEAKKFLFKIRSRYQYAVRKAWEELGS